MLCIIVLTSCCVLNSLLCKMLVLLTWDLNCPVFRQVCHLRSPQAAVIKHWACLQKCSPPTKGNATVITFITIITILAAAVTGMSPVKQWNLQQLALINAESPAEQGCVFAWLNVGCVLHLQVADSLPAQVSGSQSVFCLRAVIPHLHFLCPAFSPLRATSSFFWERRHGYSDLPLSPIVSPPPSFSSAPPHFDCLFIPKFLGTLKTPAPPLHSHLYLSCFLPFYLNQTVPIAWKQHGVTSWQDAISSGLIWTDMIWLRRLARPVLMFLPPCVCVMCVAVAKLLQAGVQQEENQIAISPRWDGGDDRLSAFLTQTAARQQARQHRHAALFTLHHRVSKCVLLHSHSSRHMRRCLLPYLRSIITEIHTFSFSSLNM